MRTTIAAAALAGALLLSGCGGADTSTGGQSSSPSPRATAASPSATPSSDAVTSPVSAGNPGVLELVTADPAVGQGTCRARPREGAVCAPGFRQALRFQPQDVRRAGVVGVVAVRQPGGGSWVVTLTFSRSGRTALTRVTTAAQRANEVVVLMVPGSRKVVVAVQVDQPIRVGKVQVSANLSRSRAVRIVNLVTRTAG